MQDEAHIIDALDSLIEVNNKRMKLYKSLVGKVRNNELRTLFSQFAAQSKEFSSTLSTWRSAYGGFRQPGEQGIGSIRRQVASMLEHWLRKNVASKCEEMEHEALKAYSKVVHMSFIPAATASEIEHQAKAFDKALTKLKTLREQGGSNVGVREELVHTVAL